MIRILFIHKQSKKSIQQEGSLCPFSPVVVTLGKAATQHWVWMSGVITPHNQEGVKRRILYMMRPFGGRGDQNPQLV